MFNSILESEMPINLDYLKPFNQLSDKQIEYINENLLLPKSFLGIQINSKAANAELSFKEILQIDILDQEYYDNECFYLLARRLYCLNEYDLSKKHLSRLINTSDNFSDTLSIRSLILYIYCSIQLETFEEANNLIFNLSNKFKSLFESRQFLFACSIFFCELLNHDYDKYSKQEYLIELTLNNAMKDIN